MSPLNHLSQETTFRTKYLSRTLGIMFLSVPLIYFASIRGATEPKDFLAEIILFGLFFYDIIRNRSLPKPKTPQDWIITLFFLFYLGSALLAENYYWSLWGFNKWTAMMILYFLSQQIGNQQQDKLLATFLLAGSLVGAFAIINYYGFHFDRVIETLSCRAGMISTFGNQNYLSAFIAPLIPLNIYLVLAKPKSKKLLLYISFTLLLGTLLYTKTRGALLGLLISVTVLIILNLIYQKREWFQVRHKHFATLGFITLVLMLLLSGTPPFSDHCDESLADRFSQYSLQSESTQTRYMLWGITLDMIKDHPLKGIGIGGYGFSMPAYQKNFLVRPENRSYRPYAGWALDAHNQYLQLAAEGGLAAAALLIALLGYFSIQFFKIIKTNRNKLQTICLLCSLATVAIHALVSFSFSLVSSAILFWFIAGRTNLLLHQQQLPATSPTLTSKPFRILILGLLSVMTATTLIKFTSDRFLALGNQYEIAREYARAEKAYRISRKTNPFGWRNTERLGVVTSLQGKFSEASQFFEQARKNAKSDLLDNAVGMNFVRQRHFSEALASFRHGYQYFPANFNLNQNSGLAAEALAKSYLFNGQTEAAVSLTKLSFLFFEQALPRVISNQDRAKINYHLKRLAESLFKQPPALLKQPIINTEVFYYGTQDKPYQHTVEDIQTGTSRRIRLFCSSPNQADAQLPTQARDIQTVFLNDARLYQYQIKKQTQNRAE